jgi:hypothetical protein
VRNALSTPRLDLPTDIENICTRKSALSQFENPIELDASVHAPMLAREAWGPNVGATVFGTAGYWCERANESRTLAESMRDRDAKLAMMAVADSYETLAKLAEPKETTGLSPDKSR